MSQLDDLRQQIDKIDDQLAKLISRRGSLAKEIGEEKTRQGEMKHFHVPQRERAILDRLKNQNKGPFPNSSVESISHCAAATDSAESRSVTTVTSSFR